MSRQVNIINKKASFEYNLLDRIVAGIILFGTEIKSIREGGADLSDCYCLFKGDELWVKNMHIAEYKKATVENHEPKRIRKLLLSKRELRKLRVKVQEKGLTIVPVRLFISDREFAKLEIALASGKKKYDKRETIKRRETEKEIKSMLKKHGRSLP